ncbi:hypothetical protein RFI_15710, partial [Reticulomyxa filosa]
NKPLLARALDNKDYRSSLIVIRDLQGYEKIDWSYTFSEDKNNTYLHQIFKKWGDDVGIVKQLVSNIPKDIVIQQLNTKNQVALYDLAFLLFFFLMMNHLFQSSFLTIKKLFF